MGEEISSFFIEKENEKTNTSIEGKLASLMSVLPNVTMVPTHAQTQTQLQSLNPTPIYNINTETISNMMFTNMVMAKMGELFSTNIKFSIANLGKLILLMFLTESKDSMKNLIKTHLFGDQHFLFKLWSWLKSYKTQPKGLTFDLSMPLDMKMDDTKNSSKRIAIDYCESFRKALYAYLKSQEKNCRFNSSITKFQIENNKTTNKHETISNVQITIDNVLYVLNSAFNYTVDFETDKLIDIWIDDKAKPTKYVELLNKNQLWIFQSFDEKIEGAMKISKMEATRKFKHEDTRLGFDILTLTAITTMICSNYPKFDFDETYFSIYIVMLILMKMGLMDKNYVFFAKALKTGKLIFDKHHTYDVTKYKFFWTPTCYQKDDVSLNTIKARGCYDDWVNFANPDSAPEAYNRSYIDISLIAPDDKVPTSLSSSSSSMDDFTLNDLDENLAMKKFFNEIGKNQGNITNKIGVYILKLETNEKEEKIDNPEYQQWLNKKKIFEEMATKNATVMEQFAKLDIPAEKITTKKITKTVTQKKINEIKKDIKTVYLQKKHKASLLSSISQYRDIKEIFDSHGLQRKLNILLYGVPGTGKSTTIQAVGTFLGKDIYYVDIKNANTNEELQMLFDYVNKNVSNGGIVVLEDIDCMTSIVLDRKHLEEKPKSSDALEGGNENKITLDYFLNILQGTLTPEDSIFIVTTNYYEKLDTAFTREGRFDVKLQLDRCDSHQIKRIYKDFIGRKISSSVLSQIPQYEYSPAKIIYHLKEYIIGDRNQLPDEEIMDPFITKET